MSSFKISELPDFLEVDLLNRLRKAMGAVMIEPIVEMKIHLLTIDEILQTTGQEVDISEVEFANDGTLLFQGRRVILHIRDVTPYNGEIKFPKFHLSNCKTLQNMWKRKRSERYVVATRHDGLFRLKVSLDGQTWEDQESPLDVCKFCLTELNWKKYSTSNEKVRIFNEFKLVDFFEKYPNAPVTFSPVHTDLTAPFNGYTKDFPEISLRYRNAVNWKCEQCAADLSDASLQRYLHVHHKDFSKSNNSLNNLQALCIECHAKQDGHSQLGNTPDLAEYRRLIQGHR